MGNNLGNKYFAFIISFAKIKILFLYFTDLGFAYNACYNLIGQPVCGDHVTTLHASYQWCNNITGFPVCSNNVTDMSWSYFNCQKLTGSPIVGPNVVDMAYAYERCVNLRNDAIGVIYSPNVTNVIGSFYGRNTSRRLHLFVPNNSTTLTTLQQSGVNISLVNNPITWTNKSLGGSYYLYNTQYNIYLHPIKNTSDIGLDGLLLAFTTTNSSEMANHSTLSASSYNTPGGISDVVNSGWRFYWRTYANERMTSFNFTNSNTVNGIHFISGDVTNMIYSFKNCTNLTGEPVCGPNVENMYYAYASCTNLTGTPVCGPKVTNMAGAYSICSGLNGQPVCGSLVKDFSLTYSYCKTMKGFPVCGPNVIEMSGTYRNCTNLTGSPVCGPKVNDISFAYRECHNLTGNPACGPNVTSMAFTYYNCRNLSGDMYCYSRNIANFDHCFYNKNNSKRINIHANPSSKTWSTLFANNTANTVVGNAITWTQDGSNYYNTAYNIYIYANTSL